MPTANNVYDVTVQAQRRARSATRRRSPVSVTPANDKRTCHHQQRRRRPPRPSTWPRNSTARHHGRRHRLPTCRRKTLSYSISGGADAAKFTIDATTRAR